MRDIAEKELGYIKSVIRLEFGARGENFPTEFHTIRPYIGDILPEIFDNAEKIMISGNALGTERTFWEKLQFCIIYIKKTSPLNTL